MGRSEHTPRRRVLRAFVLATAIAVSVVAGVAHSADTVIATVPVGQAPVAVAVNPLSHIVYVPNENSGSVSMIDGVSDTSTATVSIPLGGHAGAFPNAVIVDALGATPRAFVANFWSHSISVIDEGSKTVTATITLPESHASGPRALAFDPTGTVPATPPKLYVANYGLGTVSVYDADTYSLIDEIPVGVRPRALGVFSAPSHHRVFVANRDSGTVSVIDGDTDSVIATLSAGAYPKAIAVDPDTGYAYVTNENSGSVTVISDSDVVSATVPVGARPMGVAVDPVGRRVFVANYNSQSVTVIDADTNLVEATVTVGTSPRAIAFDTSERKAYVTNNGSNTVSIIDSTLTVQSVAVGANPYAVAVDEANTPHKAYVTCYTSATVSVIDEPPAPKYVSLPVAAAASPDGPTLATIDAFDGDETSSSPVFTGTAQDLRSPYVSAIRSVYYRLDGDHSWTPADITSGEGTSEVTWSATPDESLTVGSHVIEVLAVDDRSAAVSSSELGCGFVAAPVGLPSSYAFTVADAGPSLVRYEQTDSRLVWTGPWTTYGKWALSGGSYAHSRFTTASVTIAFEGTGIDWIGTKNGIGGKALVSLDGSSPVTVDLYSAVSMHQQMLWSASGLPYGIHTVRIAPAGTNNPSSSGLYVWIDALDVTGQLTQAPTRYQQTDPHIVWSGPWTPYSRWCLSGGSYAYSRFTNASVTITFEGTGIDWIGTKNGIGGKALVSLDGSSPVTVDLYSPTSMHQSLLHRVSGLPAGAHTLVITPTATYNPSSSGQYVFVDALDVTGALVDP